MVISGVASGMTGTTRVARAAPDGYQLLFGTVDTDDYTQSAGGILGSAGDDIDTTANTYTITDKGILYASLAKKPEVQRPHQTVLSAVKAYNKQQEETLRANLASMNPYRFEVLVKDLLAIRESPLQDPKR